MRDKVELISSRRRNGRYYEVGEIVKMTEGYTAYKKSDPQPAEYCLYEVVDAKPMMDLTTKGDRIIARDIGYFCDDIKYTFIKKEKYNG